MSPALNHSYLCKKLILLNAGVGAVWTVEPYGQIVYVSTRAGRKVKLAEMIESEGIAVDFSRIFNQ